MLDPSKLVVCLLAAAALAAPASADVWDLGGDADNTLASASDNELWHGASQTHDLGALPGPAEDVDFYSVFGDPYRSYEALITGTTGDLNNGGAPNFQFDRVDANQAVLQSYQPVSPLNFSRAIAWQQGSASSTTFLRVRGAGCGTACTADDQYTLRFRETTYAIPRFNNTATQVTTLLVQNNSPVPVATTVWYFGPGGGASVGNVTFTLAPQALAVVPTAQTVPGQSGSVLVSHDGHYGALSGKGVALEPSTGFTFDTPMVPVPD
jgi:hypothetical protein